MSPFDALESRYHLAASPIHLDVPHTSGVDWNPNGTLRVVGTSKADKMLVIRADRADIGAALEKHLAYDAEPLSGNEFRKTRVYAIGPMRYPADIHLESFGFSDGTTAESFDRSFDQILSSETQGFMAVVVRGRLNNQCILVDRHLVTRVIVEGRRGNDVITSGVFSEENRSTGQDLDAPAILLGGRGEDELYGYVDDTLDGGAGDDRLRAVDCNAMMGGAGNDSFDLASEGSCEFMNGGSGRDILIGAAIDRVQNRANMETHSAPVYLPTPPNAAHFYGRLFLSPDGTRLGGQYTTADDQSLFMQWGMTDYTLGPSLTLPNTFYQTGFKQDGSGWVVSQLVGDPGSAEEKPYVATVNGLQPIDLPAGELFGDVYEVSRNGRYRGGSVFRSEDQTRHATLWTDGVPALIPTPSSYVNSITSSGDALVTAGSTNLLLLADGASRPINLSDGAALKDARINDARMLVGLTGTANQMKLVCADAASGHVTGTYSFSSDVKHAGLMEMNSAGCVVGYVSRVNPADRGDTLVDGFYFDGRTITFASEIAELAPFSHVEFRALSDTNLVAGYSESNRIFSPFVIQFG